MEPYVHSSDACALKLQASMSVGQSEGLEKPHFQELTGETDEGHKDIQSCQRRNLYIDSRKAHSGNIQPSDGTLNKL